MIAAPWYLLAGGIFLIILGYFIIMLGRSGSGRTFIHPDMSDEEIEQEMNKAQGSLVGNVVMLLGFLVVFVSIVWRLVRFFV